MGLNNSMLQAIFYAFIFYLPFQIALNPYQDIDLMSGRVIIILLFFWWLWSIRKSFIQSLRQLLNFQSLFLLLFLFLATISIFWAKEIGWGIRKLLVFYSIFPLYFITSAIIKTEEQIKKVIKIICFSSLPIALLGIFQFLSQFVFLTSHIVEFWIKWIGPIFYGRTFSWLVSANLSWMFEIGGRFYLRAVSIFPDSHNFSFYLGLSAPLTLALLLIEKNKKIFLSIFLCQIIAVLFTFSRGGYLAMVSFFVITVFFLLRNKVFKAIPKEKKLLVKISAIFVFLLFLIVIFVPITPISKCFYSSFDFSRNSNIERAGIWVEAIDSIALHPWFGVGIGNFPKVFDPWGKYLSPINTHSTYLDIASETGIFALWAWLVLFFGTIVGLIKKKSILFFGIAGALVWFSIHAVVEVPLYNPTILSLLMVLFGLASSATKKQWDNI